MKVRVTFMTENNEHIGDDISDEDLHRKTQAAWEAFAAILTIRGSDKMSVEKVEIVEK